MFHALLTVRKGSAVSYADTEAHRMILGVCTNKWRHRLALSCRAAARPAGPAPITRTFPFTASGFSSSAAGVASGAAGGGDGSRLPLMYAFT